MYWDIVKTMQKYKISDQFFEALYIAKYKYR